MLVKEPGDTSGSPVNSFSWITVDKLKRFTKRNDFSEQFRRYRETFGWFFHDFLSWSGWRFVTTFVLNVIGTAMQGLAIAIVVMFFRHLESGDTLAWLPNNLNSSVESTFVLLSAIVFVSLSASAFLIFLSSDISNKLATGYAKSIVERILVREPTSSSGLTPSVGKLMPREMYHMLSQGRSLALFLRTSLRVTVPAARVLLSLLALLYIQFWLTLILLVGMIVSLPFLYLINFNAVQNEKSMRRIHGAARRSILRKAESLARGERVGNGRLAPSINGLFESGDVYDSMAAMLKRYAASTKSALVSNLTMAFVAIAVILHLGLGALGGEYSWTMVIAYLVLLRVAMNGKRSMLMVFSQLTRFYADLRLIYGFLGRGKKVVNNAGNAITPIVRITKKDMRFGDVRNFVVQRGTSVGIYSSVTLSRYNLYHFCVVISERNQDAAAHIQSNSMFFCLNKKKNWRRRLFHWLAMDREQWEHNFNLNEGSDLSAALDRLHCRLKETIGRPRDDQVKKRAHIQLSLLDAAASKEEFVWIPFSAICDMGVDEWNDWGLLLRNKYIFICFSDAVVANLIGGFVNKVVLLDSRKCLGVVDVQQFVESRDEIERVVYETDREVEVNEFVGQNESDMDDML